MHRRRSLVIVPAHDPSRLEKASSLAADVLVLDLQDTVPQDDQAKIGARSNADAFTRAKKYVAQEICIRINAIGTPWFLDDVATAVSSGARSLMAPLITGARDLIFLEELIRQLAGISSCPEILLEVETAALASQLASVSLQSTIVTGLCVAPNDYAISVDSSCAVFGHGSDFSDDHLSMLRHQVVAVARAHGWNAIDGHIPVDARNFEQVREALRRSRRIGFDGWALLHPSLVELTNQGMSPSSEEVDWAREIHASSSAGRLHRQRALNILARSENRNIIHEGDNHA